MWTKKPRLSLHEINKEISNRTGVHIQDVDKIIKTYAEIISECLANKLAFTIPGVCNFNVYDVKPKKEKIIYHTYGEKKGTTETVENYPGYSFVKITPCLAVKRMLKEKFTVPYTGEEDEEE